MAAAYQVLGSWRPSRVGPRGEIPRSHEYWAMGYLNRYTSRLKSQKATWIPDARRQIFSRSAMKNTALSRFPSTAALMLPAAQQRNPRKIRLIKDGRFWAARHGTYKITKAPKRSNGERLPPISWRRSDCHVWRFDFVEYWKNCRVKYPQFAQVSQTRLRHVPY